MSENNSSHPEVDPAAVLIEVEGQTLADVIKAAEAKYLGHVLTAAGGNKRRAAELAGVTPDTFRRKLALYSIKVVFSVG